MDNQDLLKILTYDGVKNILIYGEKGIKTAK